MNQKNIRNLFFILLVFGYIYYCFRYIRLTALDLEGTTYYVLFDDAMISMRYAYNLAHGNGLVWNAGERVEGITNPLWTGIMALVHLLPIGLNQTSLYIQILGASLLTLNLFLVRRIVEYFTDDLFVMLSAVALTAFYAPLNSFGLLGMEVSLLALIISTVIWLVLKSGERFNIWVYILLAISTLVRFDMAVSYLVIFGTLFFIQKESRKQHLIWGISLLVLFLGSQTLARYVYYGELLPNTYYLKVEGWNLTLRVMRGLYALIQFVYFSNWVLFLLPLSLFIFYRSWKVALLALVLTGQIAYSVYVGGDAWEHHGGANRYIVIAMPLFFIAFSWSLMELIKKTFTSISTKKHFLFDYASYFMFAIFFGFSLLSFNALLGEWKSIERWNFSRKPDYVAGNHQYASTAFYLNRILKPDAKIAVTAAGNIGYFLPNHFTIDILGKADPVVAHGPVKIPMGIPDIPNMQPGHMKWNYAYSIGELQPDVVVDIRIGTSEEVAPYLENYLQVTIAPRIRVYIKKDSPNINWELIQ